MFRALTFLVASAVLALFFVGNTSAKDGRDFAGSYEVTELTDLGDQVRAHFAARVFNYSDADVVGATILLEGSDLARASYASFPYQTIRDRESVRVEAWVTIPKTEYESWQQGARPGLLVEFKAGNETQRRPVELARGPVGEEN